MLSFVWLCALLLSLVALLLFQPSSTETAQTCRRLHAAKQIRDQINKKEAHITYFWYLERSKRRRCNLYPIFKSNSPKMLSQLLYTYLELLEQEEKIHFEFNSLQQQAKLFANQEQLTLPRSALAILHRYFYFEKKNGTLYFEHAPPLLLRSLEQILSLTDPALRHPSQQQIEQIVQEQKLSSYFNTTRTTPLIKRLPTL